MTAHGWVPLSHDVIGEANRPPNPCVERPTTVALPRRRADGACRVGARNGRSGGCGHRGPGTAHW
jgi:hypothetical protein